MPGRKHIHLTPELHQQIVAAIRAGGYPHVAAQAFGVPPKLLDKWMQRGMAKQARDPWRTFAQEARLAHAQARLKAEVDVLREAPRYWLEHGPARDRADAPGWSSATAPAPASVEPPNVLLDPVFLEAVHDLLDALSPQPDLRRDAAQRLLSKGVALAGPLTA
jgi:transposase-like protein